MFRSLLIVFVALTAIATTSCKKTEPCKAVITVQDSLGKPVVGARVILRQDSVINPSTGVRADVFQEKYSLNNGEAFFEFGLEAVLNVEVDYDVRSARDYIRLEQSETVRKTVVVK
jgi:hypothetical protein